MIKSTDIKSDYGIELINKVDSFYNSAWNKLTIIGSISFAIIGLLVPFIIQWYQQRSLKISEELLKREMENQSLKLKDEIIEDINTKFEEKINQLNASVLAKTFHLQGNAQFNHKDYAQALSDFIIASQNYLICNEHHNLLTILNFMNENCIPHLSQEEINDLKISHDCDIETLLTDLSDTNEKEVFTQIVRQIRLNISKLPKTKDDKLIL